MKIECRSFGFKNGADTDANFIFDVRCLPNPYYIAKLKNRTGLDETVRDYVLSFNESRIYLEKVIDTALFLIPLYSQKGADRLSISFGCTGGHHRSVTFAVKLCEELLKRGYEAECIHRDIKIED